LIEVEARGAWRELEAKLRPYVSRRVPPSDVDDVVQETFVRVYRGLPKLTAEERFGAWVYRVAGSAIMDHLRRRGRHPLTHATAEAETADAHGAASDDGPEPDLSECVASFVARLPSPYREAVTLTELQGLSQKEAADMVGVTLSGMKSRVQRGRERIRRMFEECCEIALDCRGRVTECTPRTSGDRPGDPLRRS
jgi:RNA polymerase sigma-70 factor (ECF subfamily)